MLRCGQCLGPVEHWPNPNPNPNRLPYYFQKSVMASNTDTHRDLDQDPEVTVVGFEPSTMEAEILEAIRKPYEEKITELEKNMESQVSTWKRKSKEMIEKMEAKTKKMMEANNEAWEKRVTEVEARHTRTLTRLEELEEKLTMTPIPIAVSIPLPNIQETLTRQQQEQEQQYGAITTESKKMTMTPIPIAVSIPLPNIQETQTRDHPEQDGQDGAITPEGHSDEEDLVKSKVACKYNITAICTGIVLVATLSTA